MNIACSRSADQLASTIAGNAWHGDSLRRILENVSAEQARARPIPDAHSIWELVLHLDAWIDFFSGAAHGIPILPWQAMPPAVDWPSAGDGDDAAWQEVVRALLEHHLQFAELIEHFGDDRLSSIVAGRPYDFYRLFQTASLHAAYHAGQIALLKKMAVTADPPSTSHPCRFNGSA